MAATSSFTLNTGAKMPAVGLGTWQAPPGVVGQAVKDAIEGGYRHIDCASNYYNEKEIGNALLEMFEAKIVAREELWITSKLWCCYHAPEDVPEALDNTLCDLQLKYIDLYLIHWPVRFKKGSKGVKPEDFAPLDIPGTWRAMEKLIATGKVRAIGVSNFTAKKLQDLLKSAEIVPAVNQVELHPMLQQPKLRSFCDSKGIHLSAYSPMGSPGSSFAKVKVLDHPIIKQTAEKLGKTPAQVALRWGIQSGSSVLPKSTHIGRIIQNLAVLDWSIPEEDLKGFSQIDQVRLLKGAEFTNSTTSPYKNLEELWDGDI